MKKSYACSDFVRSQLGYEIRILTAQDKNVVLIEMIREKYVNKKSFIRSLVVLKYAGKQRTAKKQKDGKS